MADDHLLTYFDDSDNRPFGFTLTRRADNNNPVIVIIIESPHIY